MTNTKINSIYRRLRKAEVKDYIDNRGAKIHDEYTRFFFERYYTGSVKEDLVYELPNGDFIYVFDLKGNIIPGKGNYYERNRFLRLIKWTQKVRDDFKHGRASSVDNWRFYSIQGNQLIHKGQENLDIISHQLNIDKRQLDFSYESLGKIDTAIDKLPYGEAWKVLYDALIYYVGEVIIKRVDGKWAINMTHSGGDYPYITVEDSRLHYMPINIVHQEIDGLHTCNLRKATADEIRANAIWHPKNNK